jgi:hypothetical protein
LALNVAQEKSSSDHSTKFCVVNRRARTQVLIPVAFYLARYQCPFCRGLRRAA